METLNFLDIIFRFEAQIKTDFKIELLESHYSPYSFGSGFNVYRINGNTIMISYDGRDSIIHIKLSKKHEKYPNCNWADLFSDTSNEFIENGINILKEKLS